MAMLNNETKEDIHGRKYYPYWTYIGENDFLGGCIIRNKLKEK